MKLKNTRYSPWSGLVWVAGTALAFVLAWVVYITILLPYVENGYWQYKDENLPITADNYVKLQANDSLQQTVQSAEEFCGVRVYINAFQGEPSGKLTMNVSDTDGNSLGDSCVEVPQEYLAVPVDLVLDRPVTTDNQQYVIRICLEQANDDTGIAIYETKDAPDFDMGDSYVNEKDTATNTFINLLLGNAKLKIIYWRIVATILLTALAVGIVVLLFHISFAAKVACCIFGFGILYSLVFQPFNTPDEMKHYGTAYHYASMAFTQNVPSLEDAATGDGETYRLPIRVADQEIFGFTSTRVENGTRFSAGDFIRNYNAFSAPRAESTKAEAQANLSCFSDPFFCYLPSILGICTAWTLRLNGLATVYMARAFGLLFYTILCYFAIRILPQAKMVLTVVMLLPMSMMLSISCANDSLNLGLFMICSAITFRIAHERRRPKGWETAIFFASMLVLLFASQYHLLLLTVLFLTCGWLDNLQPSSRRLILGVGFGLLVAVAVLFMALSLTGAFATEIDYSEDATLGIPFLWQRPILAAEMIVQTLFRNGDNFFMQIIGGNLGCLDVDLGVFPVSAFCLLIFLAIVDASSEESYPKYCTTASVILGILIMLSVFAIGFKWTTWGKFASGGNSLWGLQGRYFLPGIVPILLGIRLPITTKKKLKTSILEMTSAATEIALLIGFLQILHM